MLSLNSWMRFSMIRWCVCNVLIMSCLTSISADDDPPPAKPESAPAEKADVPPNKSAKAGKVTLLPWSDSLRKGLTQAQRDHRPILVRGEGAFCPYCRVMEKELVTPQVQQELQRWNLVAIDIDKGDEDAGKLAISAIPAFRILTPTGKVVASDEGVIPADKFVAWLKENFEAATAAPDADLAAEGEPDSKAVFKLVGLFRNREATVREAAIRRLLPYPDVAAAPVVAGFTEGSLSTRLVALELLREWQAPIADLDPWRAETLTESRLKVLSDWAATAKRTPVELSRELTPDDLASTRDMLDRLPQVTPPEATAIRERLARFGKVLLPEVAARIKAAATDEARERLTALRYRLVATDALVLGWPGGIEQLAATDANIRKQAADELVRRATAAEEPLLLELFSDPSPLVRELSLRALHTVGATSVNGALVNLLSDPEPNVRAAVLKQLAESPAAALVPKIVVYVLAEKDPDLVVHGTRVLGELSEEKLAVEALKKLLTHESWRVRAEAIEALGKSTEHSYGAAADAAKVDIYVGMIDLLKDPDGFVVSRAIGVLTKADLPAIVEPLVEVANLHPELASEVVKALSNATGQRVRTIPHIKKFLTHADPNVRSAAILALCEAVPNSIEQELRASLQDKDSEVRTAAAQGVLVVLEGKRTSIGSEYAEENQPEEMTYVEFEEQPQPTSFLGGVLQLFVPARPQIITTDEPPVQKKWTTKPKFGPDVDDDVQIDEKPAADPLESILGPKAKALPKPAAATEPGDDGQTTEIQPPYFAEEDPSTAAEASEKEVDRVEESLLKIREGKAFDKKWYDLVDLLKPMLTREQKDERVSSALALVALGQDQLAIPVLEQTLATDAPDVARVATALPWMLAADRQQLFEKIVQRAHTLEDLAVMIYALGTLRTPQSEGQLWALAGDSRVDTSSAGGLREAMIQFYLHQHSYYIEKATPKNKKRAIAALKQRSTTGTTWQRFIALSILIPLDAEVGKDKVQLMIDDARVDSKFRADALQMMFLAIPAADAKRLALQKLESDVPALRSRALAFLALGREQLPELQDGHFRMSWNNSLAVAAESRARGVPITPEPPAGVTVEQLLPLLKSGEPADAALAGYLLVLLDHPEGLSPLVDYWEQHHRDDAKWMRLVYRAISHLDDEAHIGVLKEIYARLAKDPSSAYHMPEFYWTIRIMNGPEILTLRKVIRTEFGAERLNQ